MYLSWNWGKLGQNVNTNGGQKTIAVCIFYASVKTKEVKRDWFLPRLVEDIETKTFCDNIVEINVNIMLHFCANILRIVCRWNWLKCIMFSYLPRVASYFGQLISFSTGSSSFDSEISQSLTSAKEKPLPSSSSSGESVAEVVKPATSYARSKTSIYFCDHDSVLKLFGHFKIVHSYYTCNKKTCFSLTEREQKKIPP